MRIISITISQKFARENIADEGSIRIIWSRMTDGILILRYLWGDKNLNLDYPS